MQGMAGGMQPGRPPSPLSLLCALPYHPVFHPRCCSRALPRDCSDPLLLTGLRRPSSPLIDRHFLSSHHAPLPRLHPRSVPDYLTSPHVPSNTMASSIHPHSLLARLPSALHPLHLVYLDWYDLRQVHALQLPHQTKEQRNSAGWCWPPSSSTPTSSHPNRTPPYSPPPKRATSASSPPPTCPPPRLLCPFTRPPDAFRFSEGRSVAHAVATARHR